MEEDSNYALGNTEVSRLTSPLSSARETEVINVPKESRWQHMLHLLSIVKTELKAISAYLSIITGTASLKTMGVCLA